MRILNMKGTPDFGLYVEHFVEQLMDNIIVNSSKPFLFQIQKVIVI